MTYTYRYAVIGSGPGGLTASVALGELGRQVCLIESDRIGGDCTNHGCVPSKAFLHAARSGQYTSPTAALAYAREKRSQIRDEEDDTMLHTHNVDLLRGKARFLDPTTLQIDGDDGLTTVKTATTIIATGGRPRTTHLQGVDEQDLLTNETIFELTHDLQELIIIGGGPVACELAEAFAHLGTNVTIIEKHDSLLNHLDPVMSEPMHKHLTRLGVDILFSTIPQSAHEHQLTVKDSTDNQRTIPYEKILLAIGRSPHINDLQLDNAQIAHTQAGISVNRYSQTSQSNIYAIGDCVADNPQFTHRANHEARQLVKNLMLRRYGFPWHRRQRSQSRHPLPWTIYTDPEYAHVGMTSQQARKRYGEDALIVCTIPFTENDRSRLTDSQQGYIHLVAKRLSLKLLGVTIIGKDAGELLPQYTIALKHRLSLRDLNTTIYAYPTKSEVIKRLIDNYIQELIAHPWQEIIYLLKRIFLFRWPTGR